MIKTIQKIKSFQSYTQGWNFGEGQEFNNKIIKKAINLVEFSHDCGFQEMDAFPGLNGEIMITLYLDREYWEFTIESEKNVTFVYEYDDEVILYKENLHFNNILRKIKDVAIDKFIVVSHNNIKSFNNRLCSSLEFSTSNIMTGKRKDSIGLLSNLPQVEEYPFLVKNVYWSKNRQSVRILRNTIHTQQVANLQFSGNLTKIYSQTNAN